ncbi:unnamed protein product, partial [Lymnaea stagnalis]
MSSNVRNRQRNPRNNASNKYSHCKEWLQSLPWDLTVTQLEEFLRWIASRCKTLQMDKYPTWLSYLQVIARMPWTYVNEKEIVGKFLSELEITEKMMKMLLHCRDIGVNKSDIVMSLTKCTYEICWNFSDASAEFSRGLARYGSIEFFTRNLRPGTDFGDLDSETIFFFKKASICVLHNTANKDSGLKQYFKDAGSAEVLVEYFDADDEVMKVSSMLATAYIVDEAESEKLMDKTDTVIRNCVVWLREAITNEVDRRNRYGYMAWTLMLGLAKLAVNDVNKEKIVEEGALSVFTDVLNSSHVLEQAACVECIWTLAFNEKARTAIIAYPGLVDAIEKLGSSEDATVRKNVEGALWVIRGNNDRKFESKDVVDKHIFISYSWKEKDLVRKIHAFLVEAGYTIWVDWEEMGGSTLESMGRAVENSWVVLICMSDGYKQSPNCRTEAGYTYQRKKQYIPLLVQLKYQPDGWLGALLESRLFFDFSGKYPFDTPKQGLLRELKVAQSGREGQRPTVPAPVPEVTGSKPHCFSFSVDAIRELFISKGFREFPEEFSNLNGELLWQLRRMR